MLKVNSRIFIAKGQWLNAKIQQRYQQTAAYIQTFHTFSMMLVVRIKNPYGQNDAKCMERDARGHQSTQPDIKYYIKNVPVILTFLYKQLSTCKYFIAEQNIDISADYFR
jgi:hypothetical protein